MNIIPRLLPAILVAGLSPAAGMAADAPAYDSPQTALDLLMDALGADAPDQVLEVLGPGSETLVRDIDPEERRADWEQVHAIYLEGYRFVPRGDGRVGFELGEDDWPFPIDVVRTDAGWVFDIDGGREEIEARMVGLNELDVIDAMEAYVDLQREFRQVDHNGDGVLEFAAHIISSDGTRDGLYWPGGDSPVGDLVARASLEGFSADGTDSTAEPYLGYYFRILDRQGSAAPGGAMDYLVNGHMLAGHALLAVPAVYGESGVHSFLVSEFGEVLEADLGEDSLDLAQEITSYNPDENWSPAE